MREKWSSRSAFVLAAIGSAVGLGNAWRFPGLAAKYGGGAFLFVYLIAMLVIGIPIHETGRSGIHACHEQEDGVCRLDRRLQWYRNIDLLCGSFRMGNNDVLLKLQVHGHVRRHKSCKRPLG